MMRIAIAVVAITLAGVSGFLLRDLVRGGRDQGALPFEGDPAAERQTGEPSTSQEAQVAELREMLEWEIDLREQLVDEVEQLKHSVQRLEAAPSALEDEVSSAPESPHGAVARFSEGGEFDEAQLRAAGFSAREIEDLQTRFDDVHMERLYLRDRAAREGWLRTSRYVEEVSRMAESFDSLREEFGDERYDWLLYASGRSNRVVVAGVFGRSPAAEAGIRNGDRILSYDSRRVFDAAELRRATTEGRTGEMVPIDLERGGEPLRLYLPRGPLGVRLSRQSRAPSVR